MTDTVLNTLHLIMKMYYVGLDMSSENISLIQVNDLNTWMDLCKAIIEMPFVSEHNQDPSIPSSELSTLPEWHCKKWAMNVIVRVNGLLLE